MDAMFRTHRAVFLALSDGDFWQWRVDAQTVLHPQRNRAEYGQQAWERNLTSAGQPFSYIECAQRLSSESHTRIRLDHCGWVKQR